MRDKAWEGAYTVAIGATAEQSTDVHYSLASQRRKADETFIRAKLHYELSVKSLCIQLVDQARRGDLAVFGRLVDGYRTAAYAIAYSRLGSADDAHDAAQEAFIEAFLGLSGLRDGGSFGAWLATIVRRQCSRTIQRNQRWSRILSEQMQVAQQAISSRTEESRRIYGLLEALSEIDREIISPLSARPVRRSTVATRSRYQPGHPLPNRCLGQHAGDGSDHLSCPLS